MSWVCRGLLMEEVKRKNELEVEADFFSWGYMVWSRDVLGPYSNVNSSFIRAKWQSPNGM